MKRKSYSLVDLFSGAGGFSLGFHMVGFKILLGIDNLPAAGRTYKFNFRNVYFLVEDIKDIHSNEILDLIGEKPDVIIGSPPCEPFTPANPKRKKDPLDRLYTDPIGTLVLHFARIVGEIRPKVWVMENVPGIIEGPLKDALKKEFKRIGYPEVYFNVLKAEDYCTPSRRTRVFVSNIRIRPEKCDIKITVEQALDGLPEPNSYEPPNHSYSSISERKLKRIRRLRKGEALIYYEGAGRRKLPNLIRLKPDSVAPTVLGSSRFIHPFEDRFLTVREQARLMGYPDKHVFIGGKEEQYNMVGESVPPPLSKAIARVVYKYLDLKQND